MNMDPKQCIRLKTKIHHSETQFTKKFFGVIIFLQNIFFFFFSKGFLYILLKINNITLNLDPDPNWAKILDPDSDPKSMYLDLQHCMQPSVVKATFAIPVYRYDRPQSRCPARPCAPNPPWQRC